MNIYIYRFIFSVLILTLSSNLFAHPQTHHKASFIKNLTPFIQWPKDVIENFNICVYEDDGFSEALKTAYSTKPLQNRTLEVTSVNHKEDMTQCHLLFIGDNAKDTKALVSYLNAYPVLTVSDDTDNRHELVMITILQDNKTFKYKINNKMAQEANIKVSHLLLKTAQEVRP